MTRIAMVYDADGGVVGEARYVVGHLLGRTECSLCSITHERIRRKEPFNALVAELESEGIEVAVLHRNHLDPPQEAAAAGALPCVLVSDPVAKAGWSVLVGPDALRDCGGDVEAFSGVLRTALAARS